MSQSVSVFSALVGSCGASLHPYQRLACILQSLWLTWKYFKAPKERLISGFFFYYLPPKHGNTCIFLFLFLTFQLSNNHICLQLLLRVAVMCFLSWQRGDKWKMCVANALCFSWGVSSEFSPHCSRMDLDWVHSLSSHTCLITLELIILHFLLPSHPSPLDRPTLHPSVCKPSALTAFLRHCASSYVTAFSPITPPKSLTSL